MITELETISETGQPPESRLTDPDQCYAIINQLIRGNDRREKHDAIVEGCFNGNPPFDDIELRNAGQAYRFNFSSRIPEALLTEGAGKFWDLISEVKAYAVCECDYGDDPDKRSKWAQITSEEFDRFNDKDVDLPIMFRVSHYNMVLLRMGPVFFPDTYSFKAEPLSCNDLLVPDRTPANPNKWPLAVVRTSYRADELYSYIRNPKAATAIGWNVDAVRRALLDAAPPSYTGGRKRADWESLEQGFRNNDLALGEVCESIAVAHLFYREFPKEGEEYGMISHVMMLEDDDTEFLFRHLNRFENWQQVIHPFYYDTGDGTHHSVKGLGIKTFAAMTAYDIISCHLADVAVAGSAMHFQATNASDMENLSVIPMGPFMWHPPGGTYLPNTALGAQMQGPMMVKQDLLATQASNLAQYRAETFHRPVGNPPTARQVEFEAQKQEGLGRSQITWYWEQLDRFYQERFRRSINPSYPKLMCGYADVKDFQERLEKRGVPKEALKKMTVKATRTIGFGSLDARMSALNRAMMRLPLYDETGRHNLIEDITSAEFGFANLRRYVPEAKVTVADMEQQREARQDVGMMKVGVPPMVVPTQNPLIYAETYLAAAAQAAGSLEQGANPAEVFGFLEIAGPAIRQQLDRMKPDPSRKPVLEQLEAQYAQLTALHDKLGAQLQQQAQKQQQMAQMAQQAQTEQAIKAQVAQANMALKAEKTKLDMGIKQAKAQQDMALKGATTRQSMALDDATTAHGIILDSKAAKAKEKQTE